jgi:hypothetical protein
MNAVDKAEIIYKKSIKRICDAENKGYLAILRGLSD